MSSHQSNDDQVHNLSPDASPAPLSAQDWEIFVEALDNPPPANEVIKKAMNRRATRMRTRPVEFSSTPMVREQQKAKSDDR